MKKVFWAIVLLSMLGCTAWADPVHHDFDHHRRNERQRREWVRHHERDHREWRHHGSAFRPNDHPGWDKGHKEGWRNNAVPPGQAHR